jgi:hypothetical protein
VNDQPKEVHVCPLVVNAFPGRLLVSNKLAFGRSASQIAFIILHFYLDALFLLEELIHHLIEHDQPCVFAFDAVGLGCQS